MVGTVHGILQARILEWVAIPSPGDLPNPGIEPRSLALQADFLPSAPPGKPIKRLLLIKENKTSQDNEFSDFLCLGRCKSLGSLKSFLS